MFGVVSLTLFLQAEQQLFCSNASIDTRTFDFLRQFGHHFCRRCENDDTVQVYYSKRCHSIFVQNWRGTKSGAPAR